MKIILLVLGLIVFVGCLVFFSRGLQFTHDQTVQPVVTIESVTNPTELYDDMPVDDSDTSVPAEILSPSITYDDEGIFTFRLNPDTVERFSGKNAWTQQFEDYYFVAYQEPARARFESSIRLDVIKGFVYDPNYSYTITVARTRSDTTYGAMDVGWYDYQLVAVVTQLKL
jgi:hypothetical protein